MNKDRSLHRKQLLAENVTIFISTLLFSKLVLFSRYTKHPLVNVPIKACLAYAYSATLDPLVVLSGYKITRIIE